MTGPGALHRQEIRRFSPPRPRMGTPCRRAWSSSRASSAVKVRGFFDAIAAPCASESCGARRREGRPPSARRTRRDLRHDPRFLATAWARGWRSDYEYAQGTPDVFCIVEPRPATVDASNYRSKEWRSRSRSALRVGGEQAFRGIPTARDAIVSSPGSIRSLSKSFDEHGQLMIDRRWECVIVSTLRSGDAA
jgi:hypothetical protein